MADPDELLIAALPGAVIADKNLRAAWRRLPERPAHYWRASDGRDCAVYFAVGKRLSDVTLASLRQARVAGLTPIVVASDGDGLRAAARHFMDVASSIICEVAGSATIIGPLTPVAAPPALAAPVTRIPIELLDELLAIAGIAPYLRRAIIRLRRGYAGILAASDAMEAELLREFAGTILREMGFRATGIQATDMVRRLEAAGWGGSRDHFFHSFQNYFFGLLAVLHLPAFFSAYRVAARIDWDVDPCHVWFLTALWHDVGYGIEKFGDVASDVFGIAQDSVADNARRQFLKTDIIKEGTRVVASLMSRLLFPNRARTGWMPPTTGRRSSHEKQVEQAFEDNVLGESHGAASALRLYQEAEPRIRLMGVGNREVLRQIMLLACASAPFHDWHFRHSIRSNTGQCEMPTVSMPFATLLAFVDSIQDDRRDLAGLRSEIYFLERLLINDPSTVSAQVNRAAIRPDAVLWKLIEARDVSSSFHHDADHLQFQYPDWMVA